MNALTGLERGFGWLLQTTWQAAVVTVIILLVQFLLRRRLSPAWRHGLWFLLVARLLMPMTPSSAVSVFNLANWSRRQAARVSVQAPAAEAPRSRVLGCLRAARKAGGPICRSAIRSHQADSRTNRDQAVPTRTGQPTCPGPAPPAEPGLDGRRRPGLAGRSFGFSVAARVIGAPVWFPYRR